MSIGGATFGSHSHYGFLPFSHNRESSHSLVPRNYLVQPSPSVAKNYWQSYDFYLEHQYPTANMASANQDEMETFQQLSDRYQPDVQGPLVGDKTSMQHLIEEYAQADPTFVAKTISLAATHSAYRPIKGDGQCGWRGAVFGYFETLLLIGDMQMVVQEETRLRSFDETLRMAGIDVDLVIDMFDYTWELFGKIRQAVESQQKDESTLTGMFNEEGESNSIVYHFKMLTSAYMCLREDQYQPFLEMPLNEYRISRIDPTNQEIDQIGLQALTDGVIAPAGIAVEVSYLDRSQGDEVTPHQFVPDATGWPTIRLLYRPGHYDVIYKEVQPIRVLYHQQEQSYQNMSSAQFASHDIDSMSYMFPGAAMFAGPAHEDTSGGSNAAIPPQQFDYTNDLLYHPFFERPYSRYPTEQILARQESWPSPRPVQSVAIASTPSPISAMPRSPSVSSPVAIQSPQEPQIRMSSVYYDFGRNRHPTIPLETGELRSSPGNPNHFLSTDFQPQMWDVDEYGKP